MELSSVLLILLVLQLHGNFKCFIVNINNSFFILIQETLKLQENLYWSWLLSPFSNYCPKIFVIIPYLDYALWV